MRRFIKDGNKDNVMNLTQSKKQIGKIDYDKNAVPKA